MSKSKHENTKCSKISPGTPGDFRSPHCKEVSPSEDSCYGLPGGAEKATEVCPKTHRACCFQRPSSDPWECPLGSGPGVSAVLA